MSRSSSTSRPMSQVSSSAVSRLSTSVVAHLEAEATIPKGAHGKSGSPATFGLMRVVKCGAYRKHRELKVSIPSATRSAMACHKSPRGGYHTGRIRSFGIGSGRR